MSEIIYAATPFRMESQVGEICDFIEREWKFPFHPLLALPYDRYNYRRFSREDIFRVCFGMVDLSDGAWIFGIGSGSFKEWMRARDSGKPVRSFVKRFDADWEEWARKDKYRTQYAKVLAEILAASE